MLAPADSLSATISGLDLMPIFINPISGNNQMSPFKRQTVRVLLCACKKLPYSSDNFCWCALIGSKDRVIDLTEIPFEGAIRQRCREILVALTQRSQRGL